MNNYITETIDSLGITFYHRDIYGDNFVMTEDFKRHQYDKRAPIAESDIVLDIGAHIGTFTALAALSAFAVIGVEPEASNVELLSMNMGQFHNAIIYAGAVVGDAYPDKYVNLYVNNKTNTGGHTLTPTRGRAYTAVKAIKFVSLLAKYNPTYLKLDCEGAEYDFMFTALPEYLRVIVGELHLTPKANRQKYFKLIEHLRSSGYTVTVPDDPKKNWTIMMVAVRE